MGVRLLLSVINAEMTTLEVVHWALSPSKTQKMKDELLDIVRAGLLRTGRPSRCSSNSNKVLNSYTVDIDALRI